MQLLLEKDSLKSKPRAHSLAIPEGASTRDNSSEVTWKLVGQDMTAGSAATSESCQVGRRSSATDDLLDPIAFVPGRGIGLEAEADTESATGRLFLGEESRGNVSGIIRASQGEGTRGPWREVKGVPLSPTQLALENSTPKQIAVERVGAGRDHGTGDCVVDGGAPLLKARSAPGWPVHGPDNLGPSETEPFRFDLNPAAPRSKSVAAQCSVSGPRRQQEQQQGPVAMVEEEGGQELACSLRVLTEAACCKEGQGQCLHSQSPPVSQDSVLLEEHLGGELDWPADHWAAPILLRHKHSPGLALPLHALLGSSGDRPGLVHGHPGGSEATAAWTEIRTTGQCEQEQGGGATAGDELSMLQHQQQQQHQLPRAPSPEAWKLLRDSLPGPAESGKETCHPGRHKRRASLVSWSEPCARPSQQGQMAAAAGGGSAAGLTTGLHPSDEVVAFEHLRESVLGSRLGTRRYRRGAVVKISVLAPQSQSSPGLFAEKRQVVFGCRLGTPMKEPGELEVAQTAPGGVLHSRYGPSRLQHGAPPLPRCTKSGAVPGRLSPSLSTELWNQRLSDMKGIAAHRGQRPSDPGSMFQLKNQRLSDPALMDQLPSKRHVVRGVQAGTSTEEPPEPAQTLRANCPAAEEMEVAWKLPAARLYARTNSDVTRGLTEESLGKPAGSQGTPQPKLLKSRSQRTHRLRQVASLHSWSCSATASSASRSQKRSPDSGRVTTNARPAFATAFFHKRWDSFTSYSMQRADVSSGCSSSDHDNMERGDPARALTLRRTETGRFGARMNLDEFASQYYSQDK